MANSSNVGTITSNGPGALMSGCEYLAHQGQLIGNLTLQGDLLHEEIIIVGSIDTVGQFEFESKLIVTDTAWVYFDINKQVDTIILSPWIR